MSSSSVNWGCCSVSHNNEELYLNCVLCKNAFHLMCLSISEVTYSHLVKETWSCPSCTQKVPKKDTTPVRNVTLTRGSKRPALSSPSSLSSSKDSMESMMEEVIKREFEKMLDRIKNEFTVMIQNQMQVMKSELQDEIRTQMKPIEKTTKDISESMAYINNKFEDFEKEQKCTQNKLHIVEKENLQLKASVNDLTNKINYIEQQSRANNIEIQCLPEKRSENLFTLVKKLGRTIKYELDDNIILHCTRVAKLQPNSSRPRSIVVQFASPRIRDNFLAACIKFNKANPEDKLNSSHLDFQENKSPIYIVEHLSPSNKALHAATRVKAKEKGYKYVWIRNGKIFTRKDDTSEHILIRNLDSLNKIK